MLQDFNKKIIAFADEYGDVDLETDKPGASVLYVPVAVLVHEEIREEGEKKLIEIQKKHFSGSPIKSKNVGGKHDRREKAGQSSDLLL